MFRRCCRGVAIASLAIGMCVPALAQGSATSAPRNFTPSEHLMHDVLATHFGLTHQQVMDLHARGYTYEDIAVAANIATRARRPISEVIQMRDRRMEWPAIGTHYGVASADLYRYDRTMYGERVAGVRTTTSEPARGPSNYAMPNTRINWERRYELTWWEYKRLRAKGLRDKEIWFAANVAAQTGKPVDDIAQHVFIGHTERQIAETYNLSPVGLREPKPEWQEYPRKMDNPG